ncbi:hypothetical protein [Fimbriiglobus ruber]|uniref:hypothetical protein n=1 Tax=Fimbriiglobus ruber TaxID=1908690 RepID=UPI00117AA74F|nr:hypothetical protein [Fimbriiglobus ruber]
MIEAKKEVVNGDVSTNTTESGNVVQSKGENNKVEISQQPAESPLTKLWEMVKGSAKWIFGWIVNLWS